MTRAGYRASAESALMRTHPWLIPATAGLITVVTALAVPDRAHAGPDVHLSRAESESVRRVAEDAEAMNRLGVLYAEGRGVSRDYSAALGWYRRAAAYGSSSALSNLATMYFYGFRGPPRRRPGICADPRGRGRRHTGEPAGAGASRARHGGRATQCRAAGSRAGAGERQPMRDRSACRWRVGGHSASGLRVRSCGTP